MAFKLPPQLMKKHSQTEFVNWLKTRKILGWEVKMMMGRSTVTVREPLGLRLWQFLMAIMFTRIAVMALTFPDQLYAAVFASGPVSSRTSTRSYGGALSSISLIIWNSLYTAEKVIQAHL
ncbi:hypothetical protein XELAEV_18026888mg [Xenopus laevis]|uniref:Tumor protein p53-inducible protein 11 n=1 Tax=Xenopus laevis TaxID=8355 RepID=A0A974CX24_XENLA|nr:hypothetical protein XELAEV_18026888mg [Xenopus laevis]